MRRSIRRQRHLITAAVDFAKDMPDGYGNTSKVEKIEIGSDEDGEMISTCIVVPTDEKPQLSPGMKLALKALDKALITDGANRCWPGMPANVISVTTSLWRATFYQMSLLEAPDGNQEAMQKAFRRAATELQARELVGCSSDHVWKVKQGGAA